MPNHAAAPVLEAINIGLPDETDCETLKLKHGITARRHGSGANTNGKRRPGDKGKESHHILQDAAIKALVPKRDGWAVLLDGGPGANHDIINALQIRRNCPGPGPANFGELVKASRDDLAEGFKNQNPTIPPGDAERLADCLVAEAVHEAQMYQEDNDKPWIKPETPVLQVEGCFRAGTLVWLNARDRIPIERVRPGMWIHTPSGPDRVVRTRVCLSAVVELNLGTCLVALAAFHKVRVAGGRWLSAHELRPGHILEAAEGPCSVLAVRRSKLAEPLYSFSSGRATECCIGEDGLRVQLPYSGPIVVWSVPGAFPSERESACQP